MRTHKILLAALFSLAFAAWATSAEASCYANFAGNCTRTGTGPANCVFDGSRTYSNGHTSDLTPTTCGSSTVSAVFWEFNYPSNASSDSTWDDLYVAKYYSSPAALGDDAVLRMTVVCADGCTATKERYLLFVVIGPGDMYCNVGWN